MQDKDAMNRRIYQSEGYWCIQIVLALGVPSGCGVPLSSLTQDGVLKQICEALKNVRYCFWVALTWDAKFCVPTPQLFNFNRLKR
jgi:hypothetical protein